MDFSHLVASFIDWLRNFGRLLFLVCAVQVIEGLTFVVLVNSVIFQDETPCASIGQLDEFWAGPGGVLV